jgi:hypothetical protein
MSAFAAARRVRAPPLRSSSTSAGISRRLRRDATRGLKNSSTAAIFAHECENPRVLGRRRHTETLRRVSLFERLSRRELAGIGAIAAEEEFPAGHELTREGDPGRSFYIILEGTAEVFRGGQKLDSRGGGEFFGEIALIAHSPRTATVKAATPIRALVISDRKFRALLGRQPEVQVKVIAALSERVGH